VHYKEDRKQVKNEVEGAHFQLQICSWIPQKKNTKNARNIYNKRASAYPGLGGASLLPCDENIAIRSLIEVIFEALQKKTEKKEKKKTRKHRAKKKKKKGWCKLQVRGSVFFSVFFFFFFFLLMIPSHWHCGCHAVRNLLSRV
jgi:phosphoenolpyruvate synthase/pyruvate phosphate dikinase